MRGGQGAERAVHGQRATPVRRRQSMRGSRDGTMACRRRRRSDSEAELEPFKGTAASARCRALRLLLRRSVSGPCTTCRCLRLSCLGPSPAPHNPPSSHLSLVASIGPVLHCHHHRCVSTIFGGRKGCFFPFVSGWLHLQPRDARSWCVSESTACIGGPVHVDQACVDTLEHTATMDSVGDREVGCRTCSKVSVMQLISLLTESGSRVRIRVRRCKYWAEIATRLYGRTCVTWIDTGWSRVRFIAGMVLCRCHSAHHVGRHPEEIRSVEGSERRG